MPYYIVSLVGIDQCQTSILDAIDWREKKLGSIYFGSLRPFTSFGEEFGSDIRSCFQHSLEFLK
jgi:hypothetical protein